MDEPRCVCVCVCGGGGGGAEGHPRFFGRDFLVCDLSLGNLNHFYNPEMMIFRPIFRHLVKFATQIYIFEPENHKFKIHFYNFC